MAKSPHGLKHGLMKLNARWALIVYPVLKDQNHWKMCENILKHSSPIQSKMFGLQKGEPQKNSH